MDEGGGGAARRTSTSAFGVGRRESHDASAFYARFRLPEVSDDESLAIAPDLGDGCILGDARDMCELPDASVALVVTSPPYFAGKEYEAALGEGAVPGSYAEFLAMLGDVFAECRRVLEPGGRIAVNVANLGRKPYRSLSSDVIDLFERLGLLLRGEIVWQKGDGASGNCAWGSFRSPANPVLRDLTERIVVASKGRFDRARSAARRRAAGLPSESTITSDEFMEATLDLWRIEPERATRVNHPAPFPVELPERLIHLFTYRGDLVLDPFMGSGSTLVAAARTGRRWVGYDLDPSYVETARRRLRDEGTAGGEVAAFDTARREGGTARAIAEKLLEETGFKITARDAKVAGAGTAVAVQALDALERPWWFDVTATFTTTRGGLDRADTLWRALGRVHALRSAMRSRDEEAPLVLLTSKLPRAGSDGDVALRAGGWQAIFDAIELFGAGGQDRLAAYAAGADRPLPGFWTARELDES